MKTIVLVLMLMLVGSSAALSATPAAPELTIYHFERMPYFGTKDGQPSGLLIAITSLIFEKAMIRHEYVDMPVRRLFESLKERKNACTLGALRSSEREAIYTYSDDFIYQDHPFSIIINSRRRGDLPPEPTIKEALESPLRLGVIDGYAYGDWLEKSLLRYSSNPLKINIGDDTVKMHKMIIGGRFDYMFAVMEEASYVTNSNKEFAAALSLVKIADAPAGNKRYLLCSKGIDPDVMQRINRAIGEVKTSARYKNILKQYGVDWPVD